MKKTADLWLLALRIPAIRDGLYHFDIIVIQTKDRPCKKEGLCYVQQASRRHVIMHEHGGESKCDAAHYKQHRNKILDFRLAVHGLLSVNLTGIWLTETGYEVGIGYELEGIGVLCAKARRTTVAVPSLEHHSGIRGGGDGDL